MANELASLYIKLQAQTDQLQQDLKRVESRFEQTARKADDLAKKATQVGKQLTTRLTLPLAAIGAASVKMASDAEEAANKFNVVMGSAADSTRARLEELTATIPLTRAEMEGMAAGIQDMLVPMGVVRQQAAGMSADMVELAGDLASFNNVGTTQVLEAMQSALAGSSEPMRRFGVDTREARLQALAFSEGLIRQGEKLDNTTRALAVLAAIQQDSTDAMGDAARTVDSTANSFRFLARDVKEIGIQLGNELIPLIQPFVAQLRELVERFADLDQGTQRAIVTLGLVAAGVGPASTAVGGLVQMVGKLGVTGTVIVGAIAGITALGVAMADQITTAADHAEAMRDAADGISQLGQAATKATLENLNASLLTAQAEVARLQALAAATNVTGAMGVQRGAAEAELAAAKQQVEDILALITAASQRWVGFGQAVADTKKEVDSAGGGGGGGGRSGPGEKYLLEFFERQLEIREQINRALDRHESAMRRINSEHRGTVASLRESARILREEWAADDLAERTSAEFEETTRKLRESQRKVAEQAADDAWQVKAVWVDAAHAIAAAFGDAASYVANLASALTDPTSAAGGFIMGAINAIGQSNQEQVRRVEEARRRFEDVLDAYVDELADMSRVDRLQHDAISGAKDVIRAMLENLLAPIKSDRIRESLQAQFDEALASLDLGALEALLSQLGPQGAAVLAELKRRLDEVDQARKDEAESIANTSRLLEEAARNRERAEDLATRIKRDNARLNGDDETAFLIGLNEQFKADSAALQELFDAGAITEEQFLHLSVLLRDNFNLALEDFAENAEAAAKAAEAAAAAEEFRAAMDMKNLELRLLVAQGRDEEVVKMRQWIEMQDAINAGRDAEYLAMLSTVHAAELAAWSQNQQAQSIQRVSQAAQESTRALDGLSRVLHGPGGLTENINLYRNRALRGVPDFGVAAASPSFAGGGVSNQVVIERGAIQVNAAPGQDAVAVGDAVYDQFVQAYQRKRRAGGINPFAGT